MKFYYLIHTMLAQKGANALKIASVAIGLTVSSLLFASLAYNYSFNTCFRDYDRLYQVWRTYYVGDEVWGPGTGCVGKLAGGIQEELSSEGVTATSFSGAMTRPIYRNDVEYAHPVLVCDSMFFETMGIKVITGTPRKDLAQPHTVYLSRTTAEQIFGTADPIGETLTYGKDGLSLTVRGLFEDLPTNVTIPRAGVVVSLPTAFMLGMDRWYDWMGNDSWETCVRFAGDGKIDMEQVERRINELYQRHSPDMNAWKCRYSIAPIQDTYLCYEKVRDRNTVMWVLGIALLLITTLNYVLMTVASMSRRAKGIGVHKCSGATDSSIVMMFFGETAIVLGVAVLIMVVIVLLCEPLIDELIGLSVSQVFAPKQLVAILGGIMFFYLVGGLLPSILFAGIPVTQVFRRFTDRNSVWKKSLLFVQIMGVGFLGGLLSVLSGQYNELVRHDMGFGIDGRAVIEIPSEDILRGDALLSALKGLPYVEKIGSGLMLPTSGYSGQGIHKDDDDVEFNLLFLSRLTWFNNGYFDVMDIPLVKGRYPEREDEVVVSEEFVRQMGWGDQPIGKVFGRKTFGEPFVVSGVSADYMLQGFVKELRPILHIYKNSEFSGYGIMKLSEPFDKNYRKLDKFLSDNFPACDFKLDTMERRTRDLYKELYTNRNSALVSTIALVFIALMGLLGFTADEVERRRKEIAIRKVNGSTSATVISLICGDVLKVSVPAVVIGTAIAWYVGSLWIQEFTVRVEYLPVYFILSAVSILAFVVICVAVVTRRVANENPVNQLKSE